MTTDQIYAMFKKDTRVKVVNNRSYKSVNYTGLLGTVRGNQYASYGKIMVRLDDARNYRSATGCFYFKPYELAIVTDDGDTIDILEENNMQNITNYVNVARIQYLDNSTPSNHYYANFDCTLAVGNLCVVKSLNHGLGLAKVVEIIEQNDIKTPREIVARVDTQDYDYRVAARKDAAELKAKMQERAKQLQDIALYQMLAEKDPEMQDLLNRYQSVPLF